jgi:hypothetical protein
MDAIYGMTMETLAETMSKHGELRAKFGEQQGMAEFESWLRGKGFDLHTWSLANNGWQDRWRADPTGRSEALFHQMLAQHTQRAHFGDVRDMSQDTEEGITLDQYAQITVAVSRQGANVDEIVRQFGLQDAAHWQRANAAWSAKMGQDTSHKLTMQFGQLYQKYAGPSFQNEMLDQSAAILADRNKPQDRIDEPQEELTPDLCLRKMQSPSQNERWRYARHYAHMADLGNVPDKASAIAHVRPILIEMIERHDEHTTSDAEDGARKLWDLGVRDDDFKGAVARCLNRAEEKLASLQAAFAPIQNQAVPERVTLQSRIQDYQSLIGTMRDYMNEDWGQGPQPVSPYAATQMSMSPPPGPPGPWSHMPSHVPAMKPSGGFPKWIIAPLVLVLVGGAFFVTKGRAMLAARGATPAASSSALAITTTAAKVPSPPTTADTTTPTASAPTASAAPTATTKPKTTTKKKK